MGPPAARALARLVARRLRAHPGRWRAAALGIAAAVALLGLLRGLAVMAGEEAARGAVAALTPEQRTVAATWNGGLTPGLDARATAAIGRMAGTARGAGTTRSVLLRAARLDGTAPVRLAAIAPLPRWVRLAAGRLPRACTAARCEVLQLDGPRSPPQITGRGLRVVVVGRGRLTSAIPLGFVPGPSPARAGRERAAPPLLVAADPAALDRVTGLDSVTRVRSWSVAVALAGVRATRLDDVARRIASTASAAALRDRGLTVTAPTDALRGAAARARSAPGRVAVAGGAAVAGLAALALLGALGLRQGLAAELARLERRGATLGQRAVLALAECGLPVLAGTLLGAAAAAGAVAVAAALRGGPLSAASAVAETARGGAPLALPALWAAGTALVLLGACASARLARRVADAALVALAAAGLSLVARGDLGVGAAGPAWALPLGVCVAAALVLGRLVPVVLRGLARPLSSRSPSTARTALLELARRPGPAALTVAALAVAFGLVAFAGAFDATLHRGQAEQAAFRVPSDAVVTPGDDLASPLDRVELDAWSTVPGVTRAAPVLRSDASAVQGPDVQPVTLLAAPSAVLEGLSGRLGARTGRLPGPGARLAGVPLARRVTGIRVRAGTSGASLVLSLLVRDRSQVTRRLLLGTATGTARTLRAALPARLRGGQLAGLTAVRAPGEVATAGHQAAEDVDAPEAGGASLTVFAPTDDTGRELTGYGSWSAGGAAAGRPSGPVFRVRVRFDRAGEGVLRPSAPGDDTALPVLTDAETAADAGRAGRLELTAEGATIPARIVGIGERVPTVAPGRFVVADLTAATGALDRERPGAARPRELWIAATGDPARLGRALRALGATGGTPGDVRPAGVTVRTRAAALAALRAEPLSAALRSALRLAAAALAALGVLGLVLGVGRALHDGAADWADHEADGRTPAELRRVLALQGVTMAAGGVLGGAVIGGALVALVVGVLRTSVDGAALQPPLALEPPGWSTAAWVVATVLLAVAVVAACAARPFREAWPARALGGEAP